MKLNLLLLLFTQIGVSQTTELKILLTDGEKAFLGNNFILAKEKYTEITTIDPKYVTGWYNLAASELNLGENDAACEHFYKVYLLGDHKVVQEIKKYCPNFKNGTIISIDDVEEKPKFIFEEKELALYEGTGLSPIYSKILVKEMRKSPVLRQKVKGKVYVEFSINKLGVFDGKVIAVSGAEEKDIEIIKMEVLSVFRNAVKYIPAKHKGKNVDLWEKITLPLGF